MAKEGTAPDHGLDPRVTHDPAMTPAAVPSQREHALSAADHGEDFRAERVDIFG
jgi:hypothetical protein